MILRLKREFADYVRDGSKVFHICAERRDGKRPKEGELLHLFAGLDLVLVAPCVRTEDVEMKFTGVSPHAYQIWLGGELMGPGEADALAWQNGFRFEDRMGDESAGCFGRMMRFFDNRLPFRGWAVEWDYGKSYFGGGYPMHHPTANDRVAGRKTAKKGESR